MTSKKKSRLQKMVDREIEATVSELSYSRYADRSFHYHPYNDELMFTRKAKNVKDNHAVQPFTDSGSRPLRTYFTRDDYVIQNKTHGAMPIRGEQPRINRQKIIEVKPSISK